MTISAKKCAVVYNKYEITMYSSIEPNSHTEYESVNEVTCVHENCWVTLKKMFITPVIYNKQCCN